MGAWMAQRLDDEPPERRPPDRWKDFLPQMFANTAGTLLAAVIVYVYAVVVGLVRANWRILAPILFFAVVPIFGWASGLIEHALDNWLLRHEMYSKWWRLSVRIPIYVALAALIWLFISAWTPDEQVSSEAKRFVTSVVVLALLPTAERLFRYFRRRIKADS